jgi:hypothetical protein
MSEELGDAPILALTLHLDAMPIAIGSRLGWLMLAGMIIRPRATSSRISATGRFSVGHIVHLLRHDALTGVVHLRHIALSASLGDPVCTHIQFLSNSFPPPVRAGVRF